MGWGILFFVLNECVKVLGGEGYRLGWSKGRLIVVGKVGDLGSVIRNLDVKNLGVRNVGVGMRWCVGKMYVLVNIKEIVFM